jgi:phage tail protein X
MATIETVTIQGDGITVDLIVYRRFRRPMPGMAERILELNQDLADLGPFLPIGTQVLIPIDAPNRQPAEKQAVRLWD